MQARLQRHSSQRRACGKMRVPAPLQKRKVAAATPITPYVNLPCAWKQADMERTGGYQAVTLQRRLRTEHGSAKPGPPCKRLLARLLAQLTATTSAKRCTGAVRDWAASTSRTMSATAASTRCAECRRGREQHHSEHAECSSTSESQARPLAHCSSGSERVLQPPAFKAHLCRRRCALPAQ